MKIEERFRTVLVITLGLQVIFLFSKYQGFLFGSILLGLLGSLSSHISAIIHFLWMKLAYLLGFIMPKILLSLIYLN